MCALLGPVPPHSPQVVPVCVCSGLILIPRRICWARIVAELCPGPGGALVDFYIVFFFFVYCYSSFLFVRFHLRSICSPLSVHDKRAMLLEIFGSGMFAQLFADNPVLLFNKSCLLSPAPPHIHAHSGHVSGSLAYWQDTHPPRIVTVAKIDEEIKVLLYILKADCGIFKYWMIWAKKAL